MALFLLSLNSMAQSGLNFSERVISMMPGSVEVDSSLQNAADYQSAYCVNVSMSHSDSIYGTPSQRVSAMGGPAGQVFELLGSTYGVAASELKVKFVRMAQEGEPEVLDKLAEMAVSKWRMSPAHNRIFTSDNLSSAWCSYHIGVEMLGDGSVYYKICFCLVARPSDDT